MNPSLYTPELATRICDRLAEGESLRAICKQEGMPSRQTVLNWLGIHEAFRERYTKAKETGIELLADELIEIADDGRNDTYKDGDGNTRVDHDHINRSRLRVDTRKWVLSKLLPRKYGDMTRLEHTGAGGGPIRTHATTLDWDKLPTETLELIQGAMKLAVEQSADQFAEPGER